MLIYTYLFLLLLRLASALSIQPSNDTLPTWDRPLELIYTSTTGMTETAVLTPLTTQIGIGQTQTALDSVNIKGTLIAVSAHSQDSVTSTDIAYISCDPNSNTSNISPTDVVNQVIAQVPNVKAILLYSFLAPHCNITGSFSYTTILSTTSIQDARALLGIIDQSITPTNATIMDQPSPTSSSPVSSTSHSNPTETPPSANQSPAPTTAVAMSILYSITGIITLLFLVIIATGAIRAHRHPERYGPRTGVPGRPRQSRAKGLARAMLETLPIVKFGDGDVKSESPAIELEEGASEHNQHVAIPPVHTASGQTEAEPTDNNNAHDAGIGPDENQHTHTDGSRPASQAVEEHLGCSICTEDFEKGEDVRVLPCNHKFHPACIDPWLLNVSGTCPLCRIDLRPAETNTAETEETAEGDTALPPPLTETEGADTQTQPARGRLSRRIDAAFMRNASSPERLAALRLLREQQIEAGIAAAGTDTEHEEQSRRARLTGRLRDAFRIRTRPMSDPTGAVPGPAAEPARTQGLEETL